ncbi:MAG TPA: GNAT family N-acetyltransferase [Oscillospiraceae bacterium]|nr:GNAT family N-acetyltransferase [Oscillospiraceae bacterium]HPF56156.1 GNAT family N-acetyltransferase [Clostridiales bacterium]HPK35585.1 GNAT family N-acetyltransferase [Oscillospiraceae bacterium]HPR75878.1 GNAT family N-acetyltransferase [Oscillospiraceae bacterium]
MIKPVERNDLKICLSIIQKGFESVTEEFGLTKENCPGRGDADLSYETLEAEFLLGDLMFVYVAGGKYVGFLSITQRPGLEYGIRYLVVLPEYRYRGYGTALLGHAKAAAAVLSAKKLVFSMLNYDMRLKNWYIENGFTEISSDRISGTPFLTVNMEMEL